VTVNKPLTINGGRVNGAVRIAASNVTLRQMVVLCGQFGSYVAGQNAITATNISSLVLDRIEAGNCGEAAIRLRFVSGFSVIAPYLHDTVYAGLLATTVSDGLIEGGVVERVGMNGTSAARNNNAYGVILSYINLADGPSARVTVRGVSVRDVPSWHGLDTHAGVDITFENNTVERTYRGINIIGPSGTRVTARNNVINRASYMGIAISDTQRYVVTGNTITNSPTFGILVEAVACGTLSGNSVTGAATPVSDSGGRC